MKNQQPSKRGRKTRKNAQLSNMSTLAIPKASLPKWVGSATDLTVASSVEPRALYIDIPTFPVQYQQVVGTIAATTNVNPATLIYNWATKFAQTFKEYCVVGACFELRFINVSAQPQGFVLVALDEESGAAPTFATVQALPHLEVLCSNTENPTKHLIQWIPQDIEDLDWIPTSAPVAPCYIKAFADPATTYTSAAGQGQLFLTGSLRVAFRGLV